MRVRFAFDVRTFRARHACGSVPRSLVIGCQDGPSGRGHGSALHDRCDRTHACLTPGRLVLGLRSFTRGSRRGRSPGHGRSDSAFGARALRVFVSRGGDRNRSATRWRNEWRCALRWSTRGMSPGSCRRAPFGVVARTIGGNRVAQPRSPFVGQDGFSLKSTGDFDILCTWIEGFAIPARETCRLRPSGRHGEPWCLWDWRLCSTVVFCGSARLGSIRSTRKSFIRPLRRWSGWVG